MAEPINKTYPPVLRTAGWHQTDTGLLWVPPSYQARFDANAARVTQREGIQINRYELHNRSGGSASVGIGFRLANRHWIAGRLSANGATYTDVTSTAQSTSTTTLQVAGADQTGFVLGCRVPFDWASVNITTAETDAGGATVPDHAVQYSDSAGTDWTALGANAATTDGFTQTNTVWAAAVTDFVWHKPADWGAWTGGTLPNGYYYLRFTSAQREASDVAAVATGMEIGILLSIEALADNGVWEVEQAEFYHFKADGLVAYFSTANAGNRVYAEVEARG